MLTGLICISDSCQTPRQLCSSDHIPDPLLNPDVVKIRDRQQAILKGLSELRQVSTKLYTSIYTDIYLYISIYPLKPKGALAAVPFLVPGPPAEAEGVGVRSDSRAGSGRELHVSVLRGTNDVLNSDNTTAQRCVCHRNKL